MRDLHHLPAGAVWGSERGGDLPPDQVSLLLPSSTITIPCSGTPVTKTPTTCWPFSTPGWSLSPTRGFNICFSRNLVKIIQILCCCYDINFFSALIFQNKLLIWIQIFRRDRTWGWIQFSKRHPLDGHVLVYKVNLNYRKTILHARMRQFTEQCTFQSQSLLNLTVSFKVFFGLILVFLFFSGHHGQDWYKKTWSNIYFHQKMPKVLQKGNQFKFI